MELSFFSTLFRVQTLEEKIADHLEEIRQHQGRIKFIEDQREQNQKEKEEKQASLEEMKTNLSNGERQHHELTQDIEKAKEHLANASTQKQVDSLEAELANLTPRADELENSVLELMESIESLEEEIQSHEEFLQGSVETLKEIKSEVAGDVEKEEAEIETINKKIRGFFQEIPDNLQESYGKVNEKYLYKKPLSFAINRQCHQCKFDIGGNTQSQVDTGRVLEFCPGCGRLLIPLAAKSS